MREHIRYCLLHLNLDQSLLIIIKSTARSGICKTNTRSDDPTGRTYSRVTTIHAISSTAQIVQKSGFSDGLVVIFRFSSFRLLSPHNVAVHRSVLLPGLFLHSQAYNSSIRCTVRSFNAALICAMNTCTSSGFQFSTRTSKPRSAASKSSSRLIRKIPPTCF